MRLAPAMVTVLGMWGLTLAQTGVAPLKLRVTGQEYTWAIRYAGVDGRLDTSDDVVRGPDLRLPARRGVALELVSADYVYAFSLPELDVSDLAVPDKPFVLTFETESPGTSRLMGSQMCGFAHPGLMADLIVVPQAEFDAWMAATAAGPPGPARAWRQAAGE